MSNSYSNKVIVLNGLARGGTNILWNILQSHPHIVSPIQETNQIIGVRSVDKRKYKFLNHVHQLPFLKSLTRKTIQEVFLSWKLQTLANLDNQYKTETEKYTRDEVLQATLCIKGVCSGDFWDLQYSDLLYHSFEEVFYISLIRDGYAVCEGWMRRGLRPKEIGYLYSKFVNEILNYSAKYGRHRIVKFEDVLRQPFDVATDLFEYAQESPIDIDFIRLKIKKTLGADGAHNVKFGEENRKYWFDRDDIGKVLLKEINTVQENALSEADRIAFEREAKDALRNVGYL